MKFKDGDSRKGICAAVFFVSTSATMVFINKSVLSVYKFDCPFFIMALQMIFTFLVLKTLVHFLVISIPEEIKEVKMWPITAFYSIHSITSLTAIGHMTVPMYTAVKRCGPLVIIGFSLFVLHKPLPSSKILFSVILITVGALIAGFGDITFSWSGYLFCCASLLAQSVYLIFTQKASEQGVTAVAVLYATSCASTPFFILGALYLEYDKILKLNQHFNDTLFILAFGLQVCLGIVLNYALYLCTTLNSALTTSLAGVLKSVLQTVAGFFLFGGVEVQLVNMTGILLNLSGGFLYVTAKYQESRITKLSESKHSVNNI